MKSDLIRNVFLLVICFASQNMQAASLMDAASGMWGSDANETNSQNRSENKKNISSAIPVSSTEKNKKAQTACDKDKKCHERDDQASQKKLSPDERRILRQQVLDIEREFHPPGK